MMKILILGHGQHGKDFCATLFQTIKGFKFESSSKAAFGAIAPVLREIFPRRDDETLYKERRIYRQLWRQLILLYNTPDRSALARKILETSDIYVGMRSLEEFEASKHLFDRIYWVDASKREPLDESMEIPFDKGTMSLIDNNGSKDQLLTELLGEVGGWSN